MSGARMRWRLWHLVCKLPNVCPANAHSVIVWGQRRSVRVDAVCRTDCARNTTCWCGKLREQAAS